MKIKQKKIQKSKKIIKNIKIPKKYGNCVSHLPMVVPGNICTYAYG